MSFPLSALALRAVPKNPQNWVERHDLLAWVWRSLTLLQSWLLPAISKDKMLGSNMEISHANELNLLQQKIFQKAIRFSLRLTQKAIFVTKESIPSLYMSLHIALDLKKDEPISAKFNRGGRKSKKRFILFCGDTHPSQLWDMCKRLWCAREGEFHKT